MATFITGSTGYLGAHVAAGLLQGYSARLNLLVRAKGFREADVKLWQAMQLHLDFPRFQELLHTNIRIFLGDITQPRFGLSEEDYGDLVKSTNDIVHCA